MPVGTDPVVDAGVATEPQDPIDPFAEARQSGLNGRGKIDRRFLVDPMSFLILQIVLHLFSRDDRRVRVFTFDHELACGQRGEPVVAEHADVHLSPFNELLGDGVCLDAAMHELHAL